MTHDRKPKLFNIKMNLPKTHFFGLHISWTHRQMSCVRLLPYSACVLYLCAFRRCWRTLSAVGARCRPLPAWSAVWVVRRKDGPSRAKSSLLRPNVWSVSRCRKFQDKTACWEFCRLWSLWTLTHSSSLLNMSKMQRFLCSPGDVLLATAFLSYSGPFNQEYRNLLLSDWRSEMKQRHIPFEDKLNLMEMLSDAPTVSEWNLQVSNGMYLCTCRQDGPLVVGYLEP